jgi:hypothetical protein
MAIDPLTGIQIGSQILGGLGGIFGKKRRKSREQQAYEDNQRKQASMNSDLLSQIMAFDSQAANSGVMSDIESTTARLLDQGNRQTLANFNRSGVASRDTNFGRKLDATQSRVLAPAIDAMLRINIGAKERDLQTKMRALQTLGPGTQQMFPEGVPIDQAPGYEMLGQGVDQLMGALKKPSKTPSMRSMPAKRKKGMPPKFPF